LIIAREEKKADDRKAWEDELLGGGAIYDLIVKEYPPEKLLEMAAGHLGDVAALVPKDAEVKDVNLTGAESQKLAGAGAEWASKAAKEWMASPDGKKFLTKAQTWIAKHPDELYWVVVGALAVAIAGAVAAYLAGAIDPPNLEKKFKVLKLDVTAGVDLAKVQEGILKSANLVVGKQFSKDFSASVGGKVEQGKEGAWTYGATANIGVSGWKGSYGITQGTGLGHSLGVEGYGFTGKYSFGAADPAGSLGYKGGPLTAGYTYQGGEKGFHQGSLQLKPIVIPVDLSAMAKWDAAGNLVLDTGLVYQLADKHKLTLGAKGTAEGPGAKDAPMTLSLGQEATDKAGSTAKESWSLKPGEPSFTIRRDYLVNLGPAKLGASLTSTDQGSATGYGTELEVPIMREALKAKIGYALADKKGTVTGSVAGKIEDLELAVSTEFNEDELKALQFRLGFTDKKEAVKFLVEASHGSKDGVDTNTIKATLRAVIKEHVLKFEVGASETTGAKGSSSFTASAGMGFYVGKGVTLGPVVDIGYGRPGVANWDAKGPTWTIAPGIQAQHKAVPVGLRASIIVDPSGTFPPAFNIGPVGHF